MLAFAGVETESHVRQWGEEVKGGDRLRSDRNLFRFKLQVSNGPYGPIGVATGFIMDRAAHLGVATRLNMGHTVSKIQSMVHIT